MSNKYRYPNEVDDFLTKQLVKRKREIIELKLLLDTYIKKKHNISKVLAKSLIVISYSHWEGYVKESVIAYLTYLNFKNIKFSELNDNYKASFIHSNLFCKKLKPAKAIEEMATILSEDRTITSFPIDYICDCESNLNYEIFEKILWRIGLSQNTWIDYQNFLDSKILKNRNDFAHGDDNIVIESDALVIADKVIIMMSQFNNELSNQMNTKGYLK